MTPKYMLDINICIYLMKQQAVALGVLLVTNNEGDFYELSRHQDRELRCQSLMHGSDRSGLPVGL